MVTSAVFHERIPHLEDEHAYYFQAKVFAQGHLTVETPVQQHAFAIPFVIDHQGKRFSKYPPGFSLLLSLGIFSGVPWLINALASSLTLASTFLLGKELFDTKTGIIAAVLGLFSPLFIVLSGSLMPHITCMAAMTTFTFLFVRLHNERQKRRKGFAYLAGISLGLAFLIRPWTIVALVIPSMLFSLLSFKRETKPTYLNYCRITAACFAVLLCYPLYSWAAVGKPFINLYTLWWPFDTVGFGEGIGFIPGGHNMSQAIANTKLELSRFCIWLNGWPCWHSIGLSFALIAIGILHCLIYKRQAALILSGPLFLIVLQSLYWAPSAPFYGARYYAEAMPLLWILSSYSIITLTNVKRLRAPVVITVVTFITWSIFHVTLPKLHALKGLYNQSADDSATVKNAQLKNALIFVKSKKWTDYGNLSWMNTPTLDGNIVIAKLGSHETNKQIMLQFPQRQLFCFDKNRKSQLYQCDKCEIVD